MALAAFAAQCYIAHMRQRSTDHDVSTAALVERLGRVQRTLERLLAAAYNITSGPDEEDVSLLEKNLVALELACDEAKTVLDSIRAAD